MAYSGQLYKNTYLAFLPYEVQDLIFDINYTQVINDLHIELRLNLNSSYSYAVKERKKTLYSEKIGYLLSVDWQNIMFYYMEWISNIIHNGNRLRIENNLFTSTVRSPILTYPLHPHPHSHPHPHPHPHSHPLIPATCGDYELMVYDFTGYAITDALCKIYELHDCVKLASEIPDDVEDNIRIMLVLLSYQEINSLVKFIKTYQ